MELDQLQGVPEPEIVLPLRFDQLELLAVGFTNMKLQTNMNLQNNNLQLLAKTEQT